MSTIYLSADDVDAVVSNFSPSELTALMALVFSRLSSEFTNSANRDFAMPHRTVVSNAYHNVLFMPSRLARFGTAVKVVSVPTALASEEIRAKGLPATTMLMDENSGQVKAIMNAGKLTALRNAAGSLLSSVLLIPPAAAMHSLVVVGSGAQIAAHVSLFLRHYPSITCCTIFNRSLNERLTSLLATLCADPMHSNVQFEGRAIPQDHSAAGDTDDRSTFREALRGANVVITATSSTVPLFPSSYISPGTHLCLIGSYTPQMQEVDTDLINRSGLTVVDSKQACKVEAGELIAAHASDASMVEIGELLTVDHESDDGYMTWSPNPALIDRVRRSGDVTIYKSVGVGVQDVAIASAVAQKAQADGVGTILPL